MASLFDSFRRDEQFVNAVSRVGDGVQAFGVAAQRVVAVLETAVGAWLERTWPEPADDEREEDDGADT